MQDPEKDSAFSGQAARFSERLTPAWSAPVWLRYCLHDSWHLCGMSFFFVPDRPPDCCRRCGEFMTIPYADASDLILTNSYRADVRPDPERAGDV